MPKDHRHALAHAKIITAFAKENNLASKGKSEVMIGSLLKDREIPTPLPTPNSSWRSS
jgi:hypothetical protein